MVDLLCKVLMPYQNLSYGFRDIVTILLREFPKNRAEFPTLNIHWTTLHISNTHRGSEIVRVLE